MLKYKLIYSDGKIRRYEFYPNGDETNPGIVELSIEDEPKLLKESEADVKMYYAIHALHGIDISKENGTVAWC